MTPMLDDSRFMTDARPVEFDESSRATNIRVKIVDPLAGPEWDQMVSRHPDAHFFHTTAWARVLTGTYGHKPFYFVATREEKIVALLPLMEVRSRLSGVRGVSLPFSDFCAPLIFGDEGSAVAAALELGRARGWEHLELRGSTGKSMQSSDSASYYGHTLDLRHSERELFEGCASSVRRALRKAEKSLLAVEVETSLIALQEFYRLHCQTRRGHGLPPQPWTFFKRIHAEVLRYGNGCVIVARQQGKPIAAAVFFHFGKLALYKFGASDAEGAKVRANNLVMWEGIKFWARAGAELLHFGRTDLDQDGLRRFKLSWGSIEESLQYLRFDFRKERWMVVQTESGGHHHRVFRHLPLPMNRVAGAMIYPHLD
jgi:hypothetical protein